MLMKKLKSCAFWFILVSFIVNGMVVVTLLEAAEPAQAVPGTQPDDPLGMSLPREIFAVAGVETNIYFDNVVLTLNAANYAFDVTCPKGKQQAERWTWTPTEADVGDVPFQLEVRDDQNRVVSR